MIIVYSVSLFISPKQPYTYNIHTLHKKHNNTGCNKRQDRHYICDIHTRHAYYTNALVNRVTYLTADDQRNRK